MKIFQGIKTLDPIITSKVIDLYVCVKCLSNDNGLYSIKFTGSVYNLAVHLFVDYIAIGETNRISIIDNKEVYVNCSSKNVTVKNLGIIPDDSPCSVGSCLG